MVPFAGTGGRLGTLLVAVVHSSLRRCRGGVRDSVRSEENFVAMRPEMPSIRISRRGKIVIGVLVALFVLLSLLGSLVQVYTNWLWFGEVGYRKVFSTILLTRIVLFLVVGLALQAIIASKVY